MIDEVKFWEGFLKPAKEDWMSCEIIQSFFFYGPKILVANRGAVLYWQCNDSDSPTDEQTQHKVR